MEQRRNKEKKGLCIFCGKNKIESETFCACYGCLRIAGLEAGNQKYLETLEGNVESLEKEVEEWS